MSRREDVQTAIWSDGDFLRLSPDAKLLYLWSFTNSRCNTAGLYRVDPSVMRFETGLSKGRFDKAFGQLIDGAFLLHENGYLWVRTRARHYWSKGPKQALGVANDLKTLQPDHPLRVRFVAMYRGLDWLKDALGDFPSTEPKPDTPSDGSKPSMVKAKAKDVRRTATRTEDLDPEFLDWLTHHAETTGLRPPGEGTQARLHIAAMFAARRAEDYSAEDLKLATVGAYLDQYRREHGHYDPESVLRPTKVHKLVEKGRTATRAAAKRSWRDTCRRCEKPIDQDTSVRHSGHCEPCYAKWLEERTGEKAA